MKHTFIMHGVLLCALLTNIVMAADGVALGRFALVIGSNRGGEGRDELKYAVSDARTFADVLVEMGGVDPSHCIRVFNPDRANLSAQFGTFGKLVEKEGKGLRREAIIYYSGHADAEGLILGNEWYSYGEIRNHLQGIGADVRIAVIDACASGSLTREKGGKHRKPFLYDVSSSTEGYAFLTSSASDEVSQESDAIGSSFFTHYLVSGMRGPADANGDGKVTLNEAYAFAYDATLQRTVTSRAGPQHAAYDIRLKGSGDLVLTDVRAAGAQLRIDAPVHGRVFVNDGEGHLLVELMKNAGKPMTVGLDAGSYEVLVNTSSHTASAKVTIEKNGTATVDEQALAPVERDAATPRGTTEKEREAVGYSHIPFSLSFLPAYGIGNSSARTITYVSISILGGHTDRLLGTDISAGVSYVPEVMNGVQITGAAAFCGRVNGVQISGGVNMAGGIMHGVQISGGLNTVTAAVNSVQITGGINSTGIFSGGVQISGLGNQVDAKADAVQISGGYNVVGREFHGCQITGGLNMSGAGMGGIQISGGMNSTGGNTSGALITGGVNSSSGDFTGISISGGLNRCAAMRGCQITGGLNLATTCTGIQIAPVNVCTSLRGIQIGVINICDTVTGIPIGLLTLVKTIPPRFRLFLDEAGFAQVAMRSGSPTMYSLVSFGVSTSITRHQASLGGGLGVRWAAGAGYVGIESEVNSVYDNLRKSFDSMMHLRTALVFSTGAGRQTGFWGGPSFNIGIAWDEGKERVSYIPVHYHRYRHTRVALWPGFVAGVEF